MPILCKAKFRLVGIIRNLLICSPAIFCILMRIVSVLLVAESNTREGTSYSSNNTYLLLIALIGLFFGGWTNCFAQNLRPSANRFPRMKHKDDLYPLLCCFPLQVGRTQHLVCSTSTIGLVAKSKTNIICDRLSLTESRAK